MLIDSSNCFGSLPLKKKFGFILFLFVLFGAAFFASQTRLATLANLRVPEGSFEAVYVQMKAGDRAKCLVSGRSGTTSKRSESGLANARWKCQVWEREGPMVVVAESKNEPSYLFAPVTAVTDLAYPWLYEQVRMSEELTLPPMRWVHLYYNRSFRGLYLEVQLPGRHYADKLLKQQGLDPQVVEAPRHELLTVRGETLICFDRKMRSVCRVLSAAIAEGILPQPQVSEAEAFLLGLGPAEVVSFILSEEDLTVLKPFPIPVGIDELWPANRVEDAALYRDGRYRSLHRPNFWDLNASTENNAAGSETRQEISAGLSRWAATDEKVWQGLEDLRRSLGPSCLVMGCEAEVLATQLEEGTVYRWLIAAQSAPQSVAAQSGGEGHGGTD